EREWTGAELKELCALLQELEHSASEAVPYWADLTFASVIDRWDGEQVPAYWGRADKQEGFFDTKEERDNWVDLQAATLGRPAKVYSGPGGEEELAQADVVTCHLANVEEVVRELRAIEAQGLIFRGGGRWTVKGSKESWECSKLLELGRLVQKSAQSSVDVQRYKGLGEMNHDQLWESTMDPETRKLYVVQLDDAISADEIFTILMSDGVEARRKYIEQHALEVSNLDI
ncbi:MAG: hypothetical protein V3T22_09565, partial [Planctomycetota bacterium]